MGGAAREVEEGEAIDGDVAIEPAVAEEKKDAPSSDAEDDGFKPIGACSPCVDLRWKTEEEEEAEEAVGDLGLRSDSTRAGPSLAGGVLREGGGKVTRVSILK